MENSTFKNIFDDVNVTSTKSPWPTKKVVMLTLYCLWVFLIVGGNGFFVFIMLRKKEMRQSKANIYIVSILIARACIGCFVVPARITGMFSEKYLIKHMCKLCHMAALGSSAASVLCMAATAVMQYKVVQASASTTTQNIGRHVLYLSLLWLAGFVYGIRLYFTNDLIQVPTDTSLIWSCRITPESIDTEKVFVFIDFICLSLFPSAIVIICYYKLGKSITSNINEKSSAIAAATHQRSMRTIRMLLLMVIFFVGCNLTTYIMGIYTLWRGVLPDNIRDFETPVYMFAYSNAWAHLLILLALRKDIKNEVIKLLCCIKDGSGPCLCNGTVDQDKGTELTGNSITNKTTQG